MRALILLVSAFLTAFAGAGVGARTAEGPQIVALASAIAPEAKQRVATRPAGPSRHSLSSVVRIGLVKPMRGYVSHPIFADRLRV